MRSRPLWPRKARNPTTTRSKQTSTQSCQLSSLLQSFSSYLSKISRMRCWSAGEHNFTIYINQVGVIAMIYEKNLQNLHNNLCRWWREIGEDPTIWAEFQLSFHLTCDPRPPPSFTFPLPLTLRKANPARQPPAPPPLLPLPLTLFSWTRGPMQWRPQKIGCRKSSPSEDSSL